MITANKIVAMGIAPLMLLTLFTGTVAQAETDTFKAVCASCHTGGFKGFMSGAPNVNEKSDWRKFVKRDSVEKMREIVFYGTKDHKAKGGCKECTVQQISTSINYMLSRVR